MSYDNIWHLIVVELLYWYVIFIGYNTLYCTLLEYIGTSTQFEKSYCTSRYINYISFTLKNHHLLLKSETRLASFSTHVPNASIRKYYIVFGSNTGI